MEAVRDPQVTQLETTLGNVFAEEQVDFVPDPMVLRAAELFILGKGGRAVALPDSEPEEVWSVIDRNLDGVLAFFHVYMTREKIPLIDYEYTFPDYGIGLLLGDVAVRIHPGLDNYRFVADQAAQQVGAFDLAGLDPQLLADIADELGLSGYDWFPAEARFEELPDAQRVAATFVTGGIIFGAYAQAAGADHLLQSKRARLFTQLAVGDSGGALWPYEQEEALFAMLRRKAARDDAFATRDYTLPPSVLPMFMLGSNPPTNPAELFERTRELRESDVGSAYRAWHTEVRAAWARGEGHEAAEALVAEVAEEVAGRLGPAQAGRATGVNLEMREQPDAAERSSRLRNWFVERIRFRGHRKLLLRMSLPQVTFDELAARLREIWDNG